MVNWRCEFVDEARNALERLQIMPADSFTTAALAANGNDISRAVDVMVYCGSGPCCESHTADATNARSHRQSREPRRTARKRWKITATTATTTATDTARECSADGGAHRTADGAAHGGAQNLFTDSQNRRTYGPPYAHNLKPF